ncbi:MAG TPA: glycosyltransferase [Pyrinomonadaceae bacterium]|nr:glycosyltransferase [Pyrinomonadaceae bacterium]
MKTERAHLTVEAAGVTQKSHLLSVMLEDYFHVGAFNRLIQPKQWYRFETRSEQNTLRTLDMLDRFNIKASFFVLGWIAERQPELIREVMRRGHEVASRGSCRQQRGRPPAPEEFRDDLRQTRETLERVCGQRPLGHRAARHCADPAYLKLLDILAEEGYLYDCSFLPTSGNTVGEHDARRFAYQQETGGRKVWEFPVSTFSLGRWLLPVSGGNYMRQLPHTLLKHAVEHWHRTHDAPFMLYFHVWELDPELPRLSSTSRIERVRQYRKLDKISWVLEDYFSRYHFTSVADYLGAEAVPTVTTRSDTLTPVIYSETATISSSVGDGPAKAARVEASEHVFASKPSAHPARLLTPVTIVVPCFNEETTLPYLANTLRSIEQTLNEYEVRFIFVDDGSTDGTRDALRRIFGDWPNCELQEHERNRGIAAALLTGIKSARTEIVCSIDCDCTYDPHELRHMIPLLMEGVDMVTASPYHPEGRVQNVPHWRLALSRGASRLYRLTLRSQLHTYTSCFRVYRRRAIVSLEVKNDGFLGVAEMLARLHLQGSKIVEHPATLEVRLFGYSKMKVAKTITGHLELLASMLMVRAGRDSKKGAERSALGPLTAQNLNDSSAGRITNSTSHERT